MPKESSGGFFSSLTNALSSGYNKAANAGFSAVAGRAANQMVTKGIVDIQKADEAVQERLSKVLPKTPALFEAWSNLAQAVIDKSKKVNSLSDEILEQIKDVKKLLGKTKDDQRDVLRLIPFWIPRTEDDLKDCIKKIKNADSDLQARIPDILNNIPNILKMYAKLTAAVIADKKEAQELHKNPTIEKIAEVFNDVGRKDLVELADIINIRLPNSVKSIFGGSRKPKKAEASDTEEEVQSEEGEHSDDEDVVKKHSHKKAITHKRKAEAQKSDSEEDVAEEHKSDSEEDVEEKKKGKKKQRTKA